MKSIKQNKSYKSVAAIIVIGMVLGAAILFWKKGPSEAAETESKKEVPQAAAGKGAANKEGEHHAGEEGMVKLSQQQIQQAGIKIAKADIETIVASVQLPGEVRFNEDLTAHIVPRVPGIAESVQAQLGQTVKKGQVLAVISSPELAELRSTLNAAKTRLDLARTTYEREKKLWEDKISAQQDYLQAQQAYEEARIAANNAQSKLGALGVMSGKGPLNRFELRAPFDGVIVEKHISLGEAVKEDANVFLLSDLSHVWVDVVVTPRDFSVVRVGETATIKAAATDLSTTGKVTYVGALVGEQTRSATARIELVNPSRAWRPGLFVNVSLVQSTKRAAITVQSDALQTIEDKPVVFVQTAEGFKAQAVVVGASDKEHVEILQGLSAGTAYATTGSFVLKAEQGKGSAAHED